MCIMRYVVEARVRLCALCCEIRKSLAPTPALPAGIEVKHIHIEGPAPHLDAPQRFHDTSYFVGANCRAAIGGAGNADYVPVFLSEIPLLFRRGVAKVDVALVHVSVPDAHGFCSLGPSVDVTRAALQVAGSVVAQVNPQIPRVFGDGSVRGVVHVSCCADT